MRSIILSLLFGLLAVSPALANELKIGYVNTERLFRDSALAVKAQKKLEQEFAKREQDVQKMIKQARDMQNQLEKEGLTLSEAEKGRKERDLANLTRDIQRAQREFREDLNQRKNEEFSSVHEKARKTILEIAEKEKYDFILENVIYASPRMDITDRVMKALER
jgi:outer membrane protein